VTVAVAVVVAPGPILFLFFRREFTEVAVRVAMGLSGPAIVVSNFVAVPDVVIRIIRIVDAIIVVLTGNSCQRRNQRYRQKQRTEWVQTTAHFCSLLTRANTSHGP
jgi:hypothetical protein